MDFFFVWLFPIFTDNADSLIHLHNKTLHKLYWHFSCLFATFNTDILRQVTDITTRNSLIIGKKKQLRRWGTPTHQKTWTIEQIMLYKILCRKLKIEQHEPTKKRDESRCSGKGGSYTRYWTITKYHIFKWRLFGFNAYNIIYVIILIDALN